MVFIDYDDMVEQITAARPNESFRNAVLPWTSETRSLRFETEALDCIHYVAVEIRSTFKNQIFGCAIVGEGLSQLLRHPSASGMPRGIEMKNPSSLMRDHEETVQHTKVSVGTVKKSIAAMASRWLLKNAAHRVAGSGFLGALRIQRKTVRSERSKPSIFSSP